MSKAALWLFFLEKGKLEIQKTTRFFGFLVVIFAVVRIATAITVYQTRRTYWVPQ